MYLLFYIMTYWSYGNSEYNLLTESTMSKKELNATALCIPAAQV